MGLFNGRKEYKYGYFSMPTDDYFLSKMSLDEAFVEVAIEVFDAFRLKLDMDEPG